jgi:penicillin-binding protein 1C
MEYYYKQHNPNYHTLPPLRDDCRDCGTNSDQPLQVIYPIENAKIFLPKGFDNSRQRMVIEAASRNKSAKLFWHLDNNYISTTQDIHTISIEPKPGKHTIIITDQDGNTTKRNFEIIGQQ